MSLDAIDRTLRALAVQTADRIATLTDRLTERLTDRLVDRLSGPSAERPVTPDPAGPQEHSAELAVALAPLTSSGLTEIRDAFAQIRDGLAAPRTPLLDPAEVAPAARVTASGTSEVTAGAAGPTPRVNRSRVLPVVPVPPAAAPPSSVPPSFVPPAAVPPAMTPRPGRGVGR